MNKQNIRLGTWNVRTLCSGLGQDLTETDHIRKTAVVDRELSRLRVDVAALQETRLPDSGSIKEKNFTFFWQGLSVEERRLHGVGFAVRNSLLDSTSTPVGVSERVASLRIKTRTGEATLICAYAPTLSAAQDCKSKFYEELDRVVQLVPSGDQLIILGDFNARVGADHQSWPSCLGHFGVGSMNDNGQRLLEFCSQHQLCVTNTYFNGPKRHRVSWRHPRSSHWHQLDVILVRRASLNSVKLTKSYHSADCDTDHTLVIANTKIERKKSHSAKQPRVQRLNTLSMLDPIRRAEFATKFKDRLDNQPSNINAHQSPDDMWNDLSAAMYDTGQEIFGKKQSMRDDWMEEFADILLPLLDEKRKALIADNASHSQTTSNHLRAAKSRLQRETRKCANEYWTKLCSAIQDANDRGDIKSMYEKMKIAIGPRVKKVAPIKSKAGELIYDKSNQLDRWIEHYSDLYSEERHLDDTVPLNSLPEMTELDIEPTMDELSRALEQLSSGKAPGTDAIPAELLKLNKNAILPHLHRLLTQCWRDGVVPSAMKDANIITLYKQKGDKGDCNNYRGISLLSIAGKAIARVILRRLQTLAERILPESQCGFRSKRSTIDMIFSVRQLQEKCREQQKPLHMAFVDLTKAFDTVSRSGLYKVLKTVGCPPLLLQLIASFHDGMQATIQYDGSRSSAFAIRSGVKQGCVLAPTLFGIYFSVLLETAFQNSPGDILLHWRTDGSLFDLPRLKAKTKVSQASLRDLLFADDAALAAHDPVTLQGMIDKLNETCKSFSLVVSVKKTVVLTQGSTANLEPVKLDDRPLEVVHKFCYLGSTVSDTVSLDEEINIRIGKAATSFGKLTKRAWQNKYLTAKTKILIYDACVLSTLLYASETWTMYRRQERKLNTFHLRCLRKILGIKWQDRVPNSKVLELSSQLTISTILSKRRMRWLGHVKRMDDNRIPKQLLYGELATGQRPRGRPKLRFKDVCKDTLRNLQIDPTTWEHTAADRSAWRSTVRTGAAAHEERIRAEWELKRQRKKERIAPSRAPTASPGPVFPCGVCGRPCLSGIGRISHERACRRRSTNRC